MKSTEELASEQADPEHAWRVAFTNYMPRDIVIAQGGSKA